MNRGTPRRELGVTMRQGHSARYAAITAIACSVLPCSTTMHQGSFHPLRRMCAARIEVKLLGPGAVVIIRILAARGGFSKASMC